MTPQEAWERVAYFGDSVSPGDNHDLRALVAEVVARLPNDVQEWLLVETVHIFIGGYGQLGEHFEIRRPAQEIQEGLTVTRVIFLSEQLGHKPKDEVLWTIAHEIAHSRLDHFATGDCKAEIAADRLAQAWGFVEPQYRAKQRELL